MGSEELTTKRAALAQPIRPIQRRPIYALFLANSISYVGSVLTLLAIPWFVLQTTGSVALMGLAAFFSTLPLVISAVLGNAIVDRLGFTRASILSDLISGLCVASIPLLAETSGLAFWQLLVLVFLVGLCKMPGGTARSSLVPDLADLAQMRRERANAIVGSVSRIGTFIGAPLAALLIAVIGTRNLLWLDGTSYVISAILIGLFVPGTRAVLTTANQSSYFGLIRTGMRFILRDSVLLPMISVVMVTNLLDQALTAVVAPAVIKQAFHSPLPLGWMYGVSGGMAFVGTLAFGAIGHRLPRRLTFGIGFTIAGVSGFWVLLVPILPLLIVVYAIAGLGAAPINPLITTILQERTPPEMRARIFGTTAAGEYIGIPIGAVLGGFLVAWIGIPASLVIMGALYLLMTLSLLINPALRKMEKGTKLR
ncbi:MAG TPA: MFS transporter [Ktedonobacterales bacterium]|nr:MFS transporter [Ktedonobacterales bacterium]